MHRLRSKTDKNSGIDFYFDSISRFFFLNEKGNATVDFSMFKGSFEDSSVLGKFPHHVSWELWLCAKTSNTVSNYVYRYPIEFVRRENPLYTSFEENGSWNASRAPKNIRGCCSKWNNVLRLVPSLQRRWLRCWRLSTWKKAKNLWKRWFGGIT